MKTQNTNSVLHALKFLGDPKKAVVLKQFFKTGPGEYGAGDQFLGVKVPDQRKISKHYYLKFDRLDLETLIRSPYHEARLTAVFILVLKYQKSKTEEEKEVWVRFYLDNRSWVNNWDLVDSSAHQILGAWLYDKDRTLLYELVASGNLWDQRIAIISTYHFIRQKDYDDTLKISEILLNHPHDLIHKAVGWMIREVGNRDFETAFAFLKMHYPKMPRTMLRYAIEKFDAELRQDFLKGAV